MLRVLSVKQKPDQPLDQPPLVNITEQHDLLDTLAPAAMDFTVPDCCAFSATEWIRVWYVRDWPRIVGQSHWRKLLHFAGDVRISLFMNPLPPALVAKQLEQQATAIQASRFEPNHTHFVFVPGKQRRAQSGAMSALATACAVGAPSLTVLVNGDAATASDVIYSLTAGRPVLTIRGSGNLADRFALGLKMPPREAGERSLRLNTIWIVSH
jgi:hypothetical protein